MRVGLTRSCTGLAAAVILLANVTARGEAPARPPSDTSFETCRDALADHAKAAGVPDASQRLADLTADPEVLAAAGNQAEFVRPLWGYIDATVTEATIAAGQERLTRWATTLDGIEARYGVDRHVLVAFWGVESTYGTVLEDLSVVRPVVRSLATLACGDPGRATYWRDELTAALRILHHGDTGPERMTGSWAGAMGHTQFMPTVYLAHAVDFDGDGRRDIWTSVPDALASTANYLRASGWRSGEGWGTEAILPEPFDYALADETTERSLAEWERLGVTPVRPEATPDRDARATLVVPAGARGPAFLLLPNFRVILRYNTALAYALTVAHLSDRLRGAPPFVRDWPRGDRTLTGEERRDLQTRLTARGLDTGGIDGKVGPKTRAAVRAYQGGAGLPPDGYADATLLERLRAVP